MALTKVKSEQLDAAQTSITSVGTLTGLTVSGDLTVDTSTFVVDSTNNRVGAGVASPQSNMHVLGTLKVATGNAQGILGLGEGAGTTVNVGLWRGAANNPTSDGNFLNLGGYDGIVFAASAAAIGSQTERMRIDSSGNLLVGTTTHRNFSGDTTEITVGTTATGATKGGAVTFGSGSGFLGYLAFQESEGTLGTLTSVPLVFKTGNTERMRLTAAGILQLAGGGNDNVGEINFGNTAQNANRLQIRHQSSAWILKTVDSEPLLFGTSNAERMRIDSSGELTLGNPSGGSALQLDVSATGSDGVDIKGTYYTGSYGPIKFHTGGAERMRIDSSGNLFVSKTSNDNSTAGVVLRDTGEGSFVASGQRSGLFNRLSSDGDIVEFRKDTATVGKVVSRAGVVSSFVFDPRTNGSGLSGGTQQIQPANQNGAVVDNSIDLGSSTTRFQDLYLSNVAYVDGSVRVNTTTSNSGAKINVKIFSGGVFQVFQNGSGSTIGYIGNVNNSSTIYSTSSDERLKENITDSADAGSRIDAIQVRQFDWKADSSHEDYGMVAQELQTVAPEAVFEPENEEDMKGIDYSKLVPMLVKEIQSLRKRVLELEK